jgi:hypothetical protein
MMIVADRSENIWPIKELLMSCASAKYDAAGHNCRLSE